MNVQEVAAEPIAVRKPNAARLLDCSLTTIHGLCKSGRLKTIRVGADERVLVESIKQFVAQGGDA